MGTEAKLRVSIDKLKSLLVAEKRAWLTAALRDKVPKIINESDGLIPCLQVADAKAEMEEAVRTWVKRVRDAALEVEDILDDFALRLLQFRRRGHGLYKVRCFIPNLIVHHNVTIQMRAICKRFHQILEEAPDGLIAVGSSSSASYDNHLMIPLPDEEDELVGTNRARVVQLGWLVQGEPKLTAISMTGASGSGKTTIVKQVFNNLDVNKYFDCHAWVTVSQRFVMVKVPQRMIKQLDRWVGQEVDGWTQTKLAEHLRDYLRDRRYVIALDDVWSIYLWEGIKQELPNSGRSSRVIRTLGNSGIAKSPYGDIYNIYPLSPEECCRLFCKRAFPPDARCPPELEEPSQKIVQRCGGLLLEIVVMGGLFSRKTRHVSEW